MFFAACDNIMKYFFWHCYNWKRVHWDGIYIVRMSTELTV